MLVQEMHIELDLILKRINSNIFARVKKEEKDWFLTAAQDEYITSNRNIETDPARLGFYKTKGRLENLQGVVTIPTDLTLYSIGDDKYTAFLPDDFFGLVDEGYVYSYYNCNGLSVLNNTVNLYYAVVPFRTLSTLYDPYIIKEVNNNQYTELARHDGALPSHDSRFSIINEFLYKLRQNNGLLVYWEKFNDNFYDNSFIFVRKDTNGASGILLTDNITNYFSAYTTLQLSSYTIQSKFVNTKGQAQLISSDELSDIASYSFAKTTANSPLITIQSDKIMVLADKTFVPTKISVSYMRKLRPINIDLNWNCQLSNTGNIHKEIVGIAARKIAAYKGFENYQIIDLENNKKD